MLLNLYVIILKTIFRELEGVMVSLMAQSSLNRREIDVELSKRGDKKLC